MTAPARDELGRDLARRIADGQEDLVLLALHIGCGALALGMDHVEPLHYLGATKSEEIPLAIEVDVLRPRSA